MSLRLFFGIHGVESRQKFHSKIVEFYINISNGNVPKTIINSLSWKIANEKHDDYKRFWIQYPKSRKRYSKFLIKDLDHPQVHEQIIYYLKSNHLEVYVKYGSILLELTADEFLNYEKRREEFQAMF